MWLQLEGGWAQADASTHRQSVSLLTASNYTPPITHTHTHSQPSTIIFCPLFSFPFYTPPSVCSACLPFCLTSCCLHLCQNVSVSISCSRFAAMPSKKKKTVLFWFYAHPLSSFLRSSFLVIYFSHSLFGSRSPCQRPRGV